jgi:hypothetical protein
MSQSVHLTAEKVEHHILSILNTARKYIWKLSCSEKSNYQLLSTISLYYVNEAEKISVLEYCEYLRLYHFRVCTEVLVS